MYNVDISVGFPSHYGRWCVIVSKDVITKVTRYEAGLGPGAVPLTPTVFLFRQAIRQRSGSMGPAPLPQKIPLTPETGKKP